MYNVYADFVSRLQTELGPNLSGFFMWWDLILHGLGLPANLIFRAHGKAMPRSWIRNRDRILDVMFETLQQILLLPDRESQKSALHGLGHLHHPGVRVEVQQFMDTRGSDFRLEWLEQCRDGVCQ